MRRWRRTAGMGVGVVALAGLIVGCNPAAGLTMREHLYLRATSAAGGWVEVRVRAVDTTPPTTDVVISGTADIGDPDLRISLLVYVFEPDGVPTPASLPCIADDPGNEPAGVATDCPVISSLASTPTRMLFRAATSSGYRRFVKLPAGSGLGFTVRADVSDQLTVDARVVDDAGEPIGDIVTGGIEPAIS